MTITRDAVTTVFLAANGRTYGELVVLGGAVADVLGLPAESEPPEDEGESGDNTFDSQRWLK